jgi:rSAM/selenodomain-associated transferase 2
MAFRTPHLSIVIPVLDEAAELAQLLASLPTSGQIEVLFVDGGSRDQTVAILRNAGRTVLKSRKGRAHQMNLGALHSGSENLLFLHADSVLAPGAIEALLNALEDPRCIGGAFRLQIRSPKTALRLIEWGVRGRSRILRMPYGDQGLFLRRVAFMRLEGYRDLAIMEDLDLVRRMKRLGRIAILSQSITTSDRRWRQNGIWRTSLLNNLLATLFHCRVPAPWLAALHTRLSDSAHGKARSDMGRGQERANADRREGRFPSSLLKKSRE